MYVWLGKQIRLDLLGAEAVIFGILPRTDKPWLQL